MKKGIRTKKCHEQNKRSAQPTANRNGAKKRGRLRKSLSGRPDIVISRIGTVGDGIDYLDVNVDTLNSMFNEIHFADCIQRPPNWPDEQKREVMKYVLSGESVLEPLCMTDVYSALRHSQLMLANYKNEGDAAMIARWEHSVKEYTAIKVGYRTIEGPNGPEKQFLNTDKRGRQYNSINGGHRSRVHVEYKERKDWACLPFTYPWPALDPLTDDDKAEYELPEMNVRFSPITREIDYPALYWDELPTGIQKEYKRAQYRIILLKKVHFEEQHAMFLMLNGGVPPKRQAKRNNTPARLYLDNGVWKMSGGIVEYVRNLTSPVYGTRRTIFSKDLFMSQKGLDHQDDQELCLMFLQIFCDIMDGKPYNPDVSADGLDTLAKWPEEQWNFDKVAFETVLEELERILVRRSAHPVSGKRLFPFYDFEDEKTRQNLTQNDVGGNRNSGGDEGWVVSLFCFIALKKRHGFDAVASTKELDFLNLWEEHEYEKRHVDPLSTTSYNYKCLTTSQQNLEIRIPVQEELVLAQCKNWQKNHILRDPIRFFSDSVAIIVAKRQGIPQTDLKKYERDHDLGDGSLDGWLEGVQSDASSCVLRLKKEHANRSREQARWRVSSEYYKEDK